MKKPVTQPQNGAHPWMRPVSEFAIVAGLCLFALLVVIPAGTVESDNFGLSPAMLPIVATLFILFVSIFTLIFGLIRPSKPDDCGPGTKGMRGVVLLVLATLIGVLTIDQINFIIGGTVLVVQASLAIGERKPIVLAAMGGGALALLSFVEWSGL
ncbi:hypothetical protein N4R57_04300 [Rhodobacteraceae bacterium D3-12]|nr:hypothetical protein N4R57_04300 [Rhodobacteraceae bacterium D3-12]